MPKNKRERGAWSDVDVGVCGLQGERANMEDAHIISLSFLSSQTKLDDLCCSKTNPLHLFSVMDGHGGADCAEYCSTELPQQLKASLNAGLPATAASITAHLSTESNWFRSPDRDDSGTTAVTCLLESANSRVMISNVGDSRALIVRRAGKSGLAGKSVALTADHDADNKSEAKRIKAAGGVIDEDGYINRGITSSCVGVQTARSIGDFDCKYPQSDENDDDKPDSITFHSSSVIATPEISWAYLEDDDILVLGCDGLFEASGGSAAWIAKSARRHYTEDCSAQEMASLLAKEALEQGSMDNVSCIVVFPDPN